MTERNDFLLKMYEITWQNVTVAQDAVWKVMAAYTAVFAGTALASTVFGAWGFSIVITLFGLLGMAVCLNANSWFARNMGLVSNIEKQFLAAVDYDKVIPSLWKNKVGFLNYEVWWALFILFFGVTVSVLVLLGPSFSAGRGIDLWLLFGVGTVAVAIYGGILAGRQLNFQRKAPG